MSDKNIKPEIIAIITAAVQSVTDGKVVAVKVKSNPNWTFSNKIRR